MGQHHRTVHEVAEDGHQFGIVAGLELFPAEVIVLGLGCVGGQHVTKHILLAREILHILVRPYGPAAGSGYLIPFEIQELVGRHVLRKDETIAVGLQHGREDYAVEHYIVFADEVHQLGVRALPPLLPIVGKKLHGIGDITDGSVEPYIEHLAFGSFDGHGNAPVEVAGNGTRLQAPVQPALDLAINVGTPLLVALQYPLAKPGLIVLQGEIPVGGLLLYGFRSAQLGMRIDEFLGAEGGAAFLALVPVGILVAALGAGANNVSVGEEGLGFGVIVLLALLGYELALVVELAEELGGILGVYLGRSASVDVEIDSESLETVGYDLMVLVYYILGSAALLAGLDGDRHAVLVAAAHIQHILSAETQVPYINVRRHIHSGKMPDMHGAVRIRQRTGHQGSLELLFHLSQSSFFIFSFSSL